MTQIVLMYHDVYVSDTMESGFQNAGALPYKVALAEFEQHVSLIKKYCKENGIDKSSVCFTFDDGGKSFIQNIAGVLEKHGFYGLFFITTSCISTPGFLTQSDIIELRRGGHIIGSHSHTHPERMDTLDEVTISNEWATSCSILSNILDEPIKTASIPNGFSSKKVLQNMIDNGITTIYDSNPTTKKRTYKGVEVIGRYAITKDMSPLLVLDIIKNPTRRLQIRLRHLILGLAKTILGDSYLKIRTYILNK